MRMSSRDEKLILEENHRRAVSVVLQGLERMCEEVELWMAKKSGLLIRVQEDLAPRQREHLRSQMEELRSELRRIAEEVEVNVKQQSRRRAIAALLSRNIIDLEETGSAGLRGYGRMSEGAARKVDAEMARLTAILERMLQVIEQG
jgi:uncharacterized membrane protein